MINNKIKICADVGSSCYLDLLEFAKSGEVRHREFVHNGLLTKTYSVSTVDDDVVVTGTVSFYSRPEPPLNVFNHDLSLTFATPSGLMFVGKNPVDFHVIYRKFSGNAKFKDVLNVLQLLVNDVAGYWAYDKLAEITGFKPPSASLNLSTGNTLDLYYSYDDLSRKVNVISFSGNVDNVNDDDRRLIFKEMSLLSAKFTGEPIERFNQPMVFTNVTYDDGDYLVVDHNGWEDYFVNVDGLALRLYAMSEYDARTLIFNDFSNEHVAELKRRVATVAALSE